MPSRGSVFGMADAPAIPRYRLCMILWLIGAALAASSWAPTCTAKDDPSVWFIFTSAPDAKPVPEFECKGVFFETIPCTQTLGLGKIRQTGITNTGYPSYELRYLPSGDIPKIMGFLTQPDGGVLYKPPVVPSASPAATPPPLKTEELMRGYLQQRNKASGPTQNVTLHVWYCPESAFFVPEDVTKPVNLKVEEHIAKAP